MRNDATDVLCLHCLKKTYNYILTIRFAFALDASDSMASTDQNTAQICPFPLVIHIIEVAILYTTIWHQNTKQREEKIQLMRLGYKLEAGSRRSNIKPLLPLLLY